MGEDSLVPQIPEKSSTPIPKEVEIQLMKILNSKGFSRSERLRRFLDYVVQEHLCGNHERVKEIEIAIKVFGKPDTFDPAAEAIVRTTANRLRSFLAHYYQDEGKNDLVLIDLPKGHYVPEFRYAPAQVPEPPSEKDSQVVSQSEPEDFAAPLPAVLSPVRPESSLRLKWRNLPMTPRLSIALVMLVSISAVIVKFGAQGNLSDALAFRRSDRLADKALFLQPTSNAPSPRPAWGRLFVKATSEGAKIQRILLNQNADFIAISADGGKIYATSEGSRILSVVQVATGSIKTLPLPRDGGPLLMSPDGKRLYMASRAQGIVVIDAQTDQVMTAVIGAGGPVLSLAITPDGQKLFLAMERKGLWRVDTSTGALAQVTSQICPENVQIDPGRRTLYVSYQCGGPKGRSGHDSVEMFDTETEQSSAIVNGPPLVGGPIAISPDGGMAVIDGEDACASPDYDHKDCPWVPSHVFHFLRISDRQVVKTLGLPIKTNVPRFLDSSRLLFAGESLSVMDASQYIKIEQWDHHGTFRSVSLDPTRRQAYFGAFHEKEIVVFCNGPDYFPLRFSSYFPCDSSD